jgi:thioredoxin-like negative regulator of GroEL
VVAGRKTNNEELLQLAIKASKRGDKEGARVMLRQVHSQDQRNETAMMWMAKIARSEKERQHWLQRVLDVNPDNKAAKNALKRMQYKRAATENRTLLLFGAVAVVMIVLTVSILVILLS